MPDSVDAPISKGDVIGNITVYYKDEAVQTVDLVATEDIEKSDFAYTMHVFKSVLYSWQFWTAIVIAVILIIAYIALISNMRNKNKRRRVKKYRRM